MKIGVITLWCSGFGQDMQAYALQQFLRNAGHDAFLIQYPSININGETHTWWKRLIRKIMPPVLYELLTKSSNTQSYRLYRDHTHETIMLKVWEFFTKHIIVSDNFYSSFSELDTPPDADAYVVGSDQVWNFWGAPISIASKETLRAYMLDFGREDAIRVSLAASFGHRMMSKQDIKLLSPFMRKLDYFSVREEEGLTFCHRCGVKNAEWVPDPTMLLDAEQYRRLNDIVLKKLFLKSEACND